MKFYTSDSFKIVKIQIWFKGHNNIRHLPGDLSMYCTVDSDVQ